MDFNLTAQHELLREDMLKQAQSVASGDSSTITAQEWKACAGVGIQGLSLESKYGGGELDSVGIAVMLVAFGHGCDSSALASTSARHLLSCVMPISKFGSQNQKDTILPTLVDGSRIAALASSGHDRLPGKHHLAFEQMATGFQLNGKIASPAWSPQPDLLIAIAQEQLDSAATSDTTAFLVDQHSSGVTREADDSSLVFDGVELTEKDLLGCKGQGAAILEAVDHWQLVYGSAVRIGTMQRLLGQLLSSAGRYSRSCKLSGRPVIAFQSATHRLGEFNISVETAKLLLYRAAWQFGISGDAAAEGAVASLFVDDTLRKSALEALHVEQEYGLLAEPLASQALQNILADGGNAARGRDTVARQIGLGTQ